MKLRITYSIFTKKIKFKLHNMKNKKYNSKHDISCRCSSVKNILKLLMFVRDNEIEFGVGDCISNYFKIPKNILKKLYLNSNYDFMYMKHNKNATKSIKYIYKINKNIEIPNIKTDFIIEVIKDYSNIINLSLYKKFPNLLDVDNIIIKYAYSGNKHLVKMDGNFRLINFGKDYYKKNKTKIIFPKQLKIDVPEIQIKGNKMLYFDKRYNMFSFGNIEL